MEERRLVFVCQFDSLLGCAAFLRKAIEMEAGFGSSFELEECAA
jgi:hypothetical protein